MCAKSSSRLTCPLLVCALLALAGCGGPMPAGRAPAIPSHIDVKINAKLPQYTWTRFESTWSTSTAPDASVLVRVDYVKQYASQTRWDWLYDWYICGTERISTLMGDFQEPRLSFLYCRRKPGPNARIRPGLPPFPYTEGMTLLLGIKQEKGFFRIVSQERK